jgi:UDP-N-acetylmuramoyl-tripeptide--D-alanyl-D-alanine ligase
MRLSATEIAQATSGQLFAKSEAREQIVTSLTWDSREVQPGALYVALPGERVDGHDFVSAAVKAGAVCVLVSRALPPQVMVGVVASGAAVVQVADTAAAVTDLARAWRERLAGRIIGITGSTGKTTTKNLVRDVLAAAGSVAATKGNQNNELGVPATVLAADADTQNVIVEMGMRGLHQIDQLCEFVCPNWGLVTNVGESHIELLGSRENIARAKAELFESLEAGSYAFVNAADDMAGKLVEFGGLAQRGVKPVYFDGSLDAAAREAKRIESDPAVQVVWAEDIALDEQGRPSFTLCANGFAHLGAAGAVKVPCKLPLMGLHNVSNACSAAAVGFASGMSSQAVADALAGAVGESGRQEIIASPRGFVVINDAYNANPDSMRASLSTFASFAAKGRRIAVLGDMGELGDFAPQLHKEVGAVAAASNLDMLICAGELALGIYEGALGAGMDSSRIVRVADWQQALDVLAPQVGEGDAILVKASHFMGLDRVVKGLVD